MNAARRSLNAARRSFSAVATVIGAAGIVALSAPASAAPCGQYGVKSDPVGSVELTQDNGVRVFIRFEGINARGQASYNIPGQTDRTFGEATGGIFGNRIDINIQWTEGPGAGLSNHYFGDITEDLRATGTTVNSLGTGNHWRNSSASFECVIPADQIPPPEQPR